MKQHEAQKLLAAAMKDKLIRDLQAENHMLRVLLRADDTLNNLLIERSALNDEIYTLHKLLKANTAPDNKGSFPNCIPLPLAATMGYMIAEEFGFPIIPGGGKFRVGKEKRTAQEIATVIFTIMRHML